MSANPNLIKGKRIYSKTGGFILIRTLETDAASIVIVEDDGSGFDPAIAEDPHTTLANIRQRLDMMCGATLDIASREGGGTVVKITIPKQAG